MAKKSVAQVTFEANTKQFDDAIKDSNRELGELRGELRLNAEEMKTTGETAEGMKKKHDLLEAQLKATHDKTEALSQKLEEAQRIFGDNSEAVSKLKGQLNNAKIAEEKAKQAINDCNDELKDTKKATKDAGDGFTVMKGVVADLASSAIQAAIGKISEFCGWLAQLPEETREIRQDMVTLETSFETAGLTVEQGTETWKQLYRVFGEDDRAVEASNLISKMSKNQKDLNKWVTITKGVYGQFQDSLPVEGLAEASMETAKTGTVTGNLADALNWSSEAADMFSKYMSDDVTTAEDAFNVALSKCSNEQERQALITETLTKLYGDSAAKFEEASGAQLDAKEKTAENILVQNELADTMEPLTTSWQGFKNELLVGVLPVVEKVSGWGVSAIEWMKKHPTAMKAIAAAVGVLAVGLGALAIAAGVYTAAQWAMNAAILANPITWIVVAIVAAIAAVVAIVVVVIEYWDELKAAAIGCWEKIKSVWNKVATWFDKNVIQPVVNFFVGLWNGIVSIFQSVIDWVKNNWKSIVLFIVNPFAGVFSYLYNNFEGFKNFIDKTVSAIKNFFVGLWNGVKQVWDWICDAAQFAVMLLGSIFKGAFDIITLPFRFIWENCKQYVFAAFEWIKEKISLAVTAISNLWAKIKDAAAACWNAIKQTWSVVTTWCRETIVVPLLNFFSNLWNGIKNLAVSCWNWIKQTWANVATWFHQNIIVPVVNFFVGLWNDIKNAAAACWNGIKVAWSAVTTWFQTRIIQPVVSFFVGLWSKIKETFANVKGWFVDKFNSAKEGIINIWSSVTGKFSEIKNKIVSAFANIKEKISAPFEKARDAVKGVIDKIKGFFSGLKLNLPKIKLPHFKIEGKLSISPPSVPKLKIDWYKDGGIMTKPTIFGFNGNRIMAGGEAGAEAILPIDRLEGYVSNAVEKTMRALDVQTLAAAMNNLANRPTKLYINGKEFAYATASDMDGVNGMRNTLADIGLILE